MRIASLLVAATLVAVSTVSPAQDKSMQQQAEEDWQELKDAAGKAGSKVKAWGKAAGDKAAEMTDQAREAMAEESGGDKGKAASRFYYR